MTLTVDIMVGTSITSAVDNVITVFCVFLFSS